MSTYIALLRGINVGGHARLAMADLRAVLEELGHADVRTYLQSGNAVFNVKGRKSSPTLGGEVESMLTARLGLDVKVLVCTRDQLASVIDANPFAAASSDAKQLHVMFLSANPSAKVMQSLEVERFAPDELQVGDQVLYLKLPNGLGRSKLPPYLSERRLGVVATTRNWNTVTTLRELADA